MKKLSTLERPALFVIILLLLWGLLMLIWPSAIYRWFPPLLGLILIIGGALRIAHSFVMRARLPRPLASTIQGLLSVIAGLIFLYACNFSLSFLSIFFGIYVLIGAIVHFISLFTDTHTVDSRASTIITGIFQLVLGGLLLLAPLSGQAIWIRLLGLHFIVSTVSLTIWITQSPKSTGTSKKDETQSES